MPRPPSASDWLSLIILTIFWGSAFALNDVALGSFSPSALVAGRLVTATLIVVMFMKAKGISLPRRPQQWIPMAVTATLGNLLPFQFIAWAQQHIASGMAAVLMSVMPLFVLTLSHFFVPGARLTPLRLAGFGAGFAGVTLVVTPALPGAGDLPLWGILAVLGAAASYSINSIYARRLGAIDPVQLAAGMLVVASAVSIPVAGSGPVIIGELTLAATLATLTLGLFATGVATLLYFRVIQGPGPAFLSMVTYLVPVWALIVGALFLDESLPTSAIIGLGFILAGIGVSEFGPTLGRGLRRRILLRRLVRPAVTTAEEL